MSKFIIENDTGNVLDFGIEVYFDPAQQTHRLVLKKVSSGKPSEQPQPQSGKLTGIQLRTIAAVDQLQALLDDELYETIKTLSEASDRQLISSLHQATDSESCGRAKMRDPDFDPNITIRAVKAMALFCYTEIVERGLNRPGT